MRDQPRLEESGGELIWNPYVGKKGQISDLPPRSRLSQCQPTSWRQGFRDAGPERKMQLHSEDDRSKNIWFEYDCTQGDQQEGRGRKRGISLGNWCGNLRAGCFTVLPLDCSKTIPDSKNGVMDRPCLGFKSRQDWQRDPISLECH